MKTRNLKCPLCDHEQEARMTPHQTAYRCKNCEKLVRAIDAPKKAKEESKKEEAPKAEEKKTETKKRSRRSKKK